MTTSKGTIQGYNGIASVDKKHQIIIDPQAFVEEQEYHVLQPVLKTILTLYQRLNILPIYMNQEFTLPQTPATPTKPT